MGAYRIADILDMQSAKTLYCALVESFLNYGITVWGGASEYLMLRLQRSQNCVISNLSLSGRADDADYKSVGVLRVLDLYKYRVITENYFKPSYRQRAEKTYGTRQVQRFVVNRCFNKYGERTREVLIPKLLNGLPAELGDLQRISILKTKLKQLLLTGL